MKGELIKVLRTHCNLGKMWFYSFELPLNYNMKRSWFDCYHS